MTLQEIREKFGLSALVLTVVVAMLVTLVFGFQLARYQSDDQSRRLAASNETLTVLEAENHSLKTQLHQRSAALALAEMEVTQANALMADLEDEVAGLRDQLGFYQRVMAPETTQDGFFVDGISVTPAASTNHYRLRFVLMQQRSNKAVIKGDLHLTVEGSLDGKPHTLKTGTDAFMPDGPVIYRFKFFQNVDIGITLPENFVAESLIFATNVYQYTTLRGYYEKSVKWQSISSKDVQQGD